MVDATRHVIALKGPKLNLRIRFPEKDNAHRVPGEHGIEKKFDSIFIPDEVALDRWKNNVLVVNLVDEFINRH
jgi:hypothetical protein